MRIYYVRTIEGTLVRFEVRHGCNILFPFLENFSLIFHVVSLLADDSHEKTKNKKKLDFLCFSH